MDFPKILNDNQVDGKITTSKLKLILKNDYRHLIKPTILFKHGYRLSSDRLYIESIDASDTSAPEVTIDEEPVAPNTIIPKAISINEEQTEAQGYIYLLEDFPRQKYLLGLHLRSLYNIPNHLLVVTLNVLNLFQLSYLCNKLPSLNTAGEMLDEVDRIVNIPMEKLWYS